jgi:hypothetical protein
VARIKGAALLKNDTALFTAYQPSEKRHAKTPFFSMTYQEVICDRQAQPFSHRF